MGDREPAAAPRTAEPGRPPLTVAVQRVGGVLKLVINGQVCEPLAYRSYRPTPELVRGFHATGLRLANLTHTGMLCTLDVPYSLFGEVWTGPEQFDWDTVEAQMALFEANAPGAWYNVALQLDTRDWFLAAHPECSSSYWNLVEMAGHEPWREATAASLQALLRGLEARYGDRIFAYTLLCGASTEWYTNSQGNGREEAQLRAHPLKEAAFRRWTGDPQATLPDLAELHRISDGDLRHPLEEAAALRYWRFHHQIIGDAILYFLSKAQEVLQHRKLLGLFYGYLTQLDGQRLLNEGHLGYEPVWRSPDLDMLYAPAKYGEPRSASGASGYLVTVDSLDLHHKLLFHEVDHTTHIARATVENGRRIPGSDTKLPDAEATQQVLRREFAMTRAKRTGLWWFDFLGGNYASDELLAMVSELVQAQGRLTDLSLRSVAQIAVFGDVGSMVHAAATAPLATDLLVQPPDALARIGAPYDIFNFSDLLHPELDWERYRMVVFLNALCVDPEQESFIRQRVSAAGRTLVWCYAPGYITATGLAAERIGDLCGMAVRRRASADGRVQIGGLRAGFSRPVDPTFEVTATDVEVLGRYVTDGAPALARRRLPSHQSIYSAVGGLPSAVWRQFAGWAGVHRYSATADPLYLNNRLIAIQQQADSGPVLELPTIAAGTLEDLYGGEVFAVSAGRCALPAARGRSRLLLASQDLGPGS